MRSTNLVIALRHNFCSKVLTLVSAKSVVGWNAAEWARWNNPWLVDLAHCATPKPWDRILWGICVRRPSFMTTCAAHSRARNLFGILSPRARKFAAQCHGPFMKKHFWQTSVLTNCFVAFTKNGIRKDHSTCWTTTSGDLLHFRDTFVTLSTLHPLNPLELDLKRVWFWRPQIHGHRMFYSITLWPESMLHGEIRGETEVRTTNSGTDSTNTQAAKAMMKLSPWQSCKKWSWKSHEFSAR